MIDKEKLAMEAEVIISGYAINPCNEGLRVINLNNGGNIALLKMDGSLIETNMDDIELEIAKGYSMQAIKYLEV